MYELSFYRDSKKVCDHRLDVWDMSIGSKQDDDIRTLDGLENIHARLRWSGRGWQLTYEEGGIRDTAPLGVGEPFPIGPYTALLQRQPTTLQRPMVPERLHEAIGGEPDKPCAQVAVLTVLTGPDAGTQWPLKAHRVSLGARGSTIMLQDPLLQTHHCRLKVTMARVSLEKGNGPVYLRNQLIDANIPLHPEDVIRIGRTRLQYTIQDCDISTAPRFGRMKGRSRRFKTIFGRLHRLAGHEFNVQLCGEPGTGKSLAAQTIHEHSSRQDGPLVFFRCDAPPHRDVARALFGEGDRDGLLHEADDGTLVLQEVGALPLDVQQRLATTLASGEVCRLGEDIGARVDFRLITTTSQDLSALVEADAFREDLLVNLLGGVVRLPPLRVCRADLDCLIRHFLNNSNTPVLTGADLDLLMNHPWPCNVRELKNVLTEFTVHGSERLLELTGSPEDQRQDILERLNRHRWNIRRTAGEIGLSDSGLVYRMKKLGLR